MGTFEKYDVLINVDTNEIIYINQKTGEQYVPSTKKTTKSKKVEDTDPVAKLTLLEGKYQLNAAAVELMGLKPDMKIAIKYERVNKTTSPVIGTDESWGTKTGNRLTKTFTVACKGEGREALIKYGTTFVIKPHETKEGLFKLIGDSVPEETSEISEETKKEIELPDDVPFNLDILNDEDDTSNTTISSMDLDFTI